MSNGLKPQVASSSPSVPTDLMDSTPDEARGFGVQYKALKELSKSGIVTLVLISVLAGFVIGQSPEHSFAWGRLVMTLLGILFLASGSSALNQYQESHLDSQMPRTANRPIPSGRLSAGAVLSFVIITLVIGLLTLWALDVQLLALGMAAVVLYNGLYTLWWKPKWAYAAVPGAIPGALPILMGYVAASGSIVDPRGWYLFLVLFFWQMPHFWVLALRYQDDYKKGGFPTLPVTHGNSLTVHQITLWCLAYIGTVMLAPFFFMTSWVYLGLTVAMTAPVLYGLYRFTQKPESQSWLHFFLWINLSLIVYLGALAVDVWTQEWMVILREAIRFET